MEEENREPPSERINDVIIKEETKPQFHWYILSLFCIYAGSWLIPGIIFMVYVLSFFLPYFLDVPFFFSLFTSIYPILGLITFPLIIISCYLIHLFVVALITRIFWRYTEKKSPSKPGIIPRNIRSKTLDFYHLRSFLIKYPKNAFVRGPFPWLLNFLLNFVGSAKIGKGTTVEEQVVGAKFYETGENCYIGANSSLATHVVEGIFGNVQYFPIKLGDNVTLDGFTTIGPGCDLDDDTYVFPMSAATKFNKTKGNNYYYGMPFRRIFKKKIMNYLKITEEELTKTVALRNKQHKKRSKKKIRRRISIIPQGGLNDRKSQE